MIRKTLRFLVLVIALVVLYYGSQKIRIRIPNLNLPIPQATMTLPDWTEEKVLMEINNYRQAKNLGVLTTNEKLKKAAMARLSVVIEYEDVLGDITGLSREKALETVDYNYSWIGDLAVTNYFRSNDLVSYWASLDNSKATLEEPNLKDVGIAIKQSGETMSIYVLLSTPRKAIKATTRTPIAASKASWGGPELWDAVNKRRVELGVNPLRQKDELCTIAAIRLNQILDLGKLDAHAGFEPTLNREDLKWISEKYNISEFLVSGYDSAQESVNAWENTLGHKKLLSGGEYVWGCVYAQNGFGVAIAAY